MITPTRRFGSSRNSTDKSEYDDAEALQKMVVDMLGELDADEKKELIASKTIKVKVATAIDLNTSEDKEIAGDLSGITDYSHNKRAGRVISTKHMKMVRKCKRYYTARCYYQYRK